jgi:hypothetical protein
MITIISTILIVIFLFLSGLHFYWGFGGEWGNGAVIPTKNDDTKVIMPGVIPTFIVAFGLLGFAIVIVMNAVTLDFKLPLWLDIIRKYGLLFIAVIFTLRAIGEFNYVGFFKKYKQTKFGQNDSKYYSPLCLTIGILALLLELIK